MQDLLYIDNLSFIMIGLISFVGIIIASFSHNYLHGDRKQSAFYYNLFILLISACVMVSANHFVLFFVSWGISNFFLTRLMMHKHEWSAARVSSKLALNNFVLGLLFLGSAFVILYLATGHITIQEIVHTPFDQSFLIMSTLLLLLAAMTQSALWPFHKWLTSSLNSPTPVSALMHAGLINGGGFLLARFAPLFLSNQVVLHVIFIVGMCSALLGTLWKLMQSDIKRMLASSTMGQMGFMIAQCGLGLFHAAVAHLFWHGLFKAYLFLSSASAAQKKQLELNYPPTIPEVLFALFCGGVGTSIFAFASGKSIFTLDTTFFVIIVAFMFATQCALTALRHAPFFKMPFAVIVPIIVGAVYGISVHTIYELLEPLHIAQAQPFTFVYAVGLVLLSGAWVVMLFGKKIIIGHKYPDIVLRLYVRMVNASQPDERTITAHRNEYKV